MISNPIKICELKIHRIQSKRVQNLAKMFLGNIGGGLPPSFLFQLYSQKNFPEKNGSFHGRRIII